MPADGAEDVDSAWSDAEEEEDTSTDVDPLLEAAEREGRLLARIAELEDEVVKLRERVDRTQTALSVALEQLAITGVHESPTVPPPARVTMPLPKNADDALAPVRDDTADE